MSTASYVTIWCDRDADAPLMNCGASVFGDDAKSAREEAKRYGWQVNVPSKTGRRDFCPKHAPVSTATDKEQ